MPMATPRGAMRVKKKRRNNTLTDLVAGMAESSDSSETVTMAWRMEMAAVVVIVVVVVQMFASISVQKPHRQTVEGGVDGVGQEQRHGLHVGACR